MNSLTLKIEFRYFEINIRKIFNVLNFYFQKSIV